jgi:hypothetical protein
MSKNVFPRRKNIDWMNQLKILMMFSYNIKIDHNKLYIRPVKIKTC